MTKNDWDPIRPIRMPDRLWDEFEECAAAQGRSRSEIVRDLVRRHVAAWKGRQPKGDHDGSSSTSR